MAIHGLCLLVGQPDEALELCINILCAQNQGGVVSIGGLIRQAMGAKGVLETAAITRAISDTEAALEAGARAVATADREEARISQRTT